MKKIVMIVLVSFLGIARPSYAQVATNARPCYGGQTDPRQRHNLEEEKQNYIEESEDAKSLLEEGCLSLEEQQAERDAIIRGGAVDYEVNLFSTEDGFRLSLYMIYADGSKKNLWEHLAQQFNEALPIENMVDA